MMPVDSDDAPAPAVDLADERRPPLPPCQDCQRSAAAARESDPGQMGTSDGRISLGGAFVAWIQTRDPAQSSAEAARTHLLRAETLSA